MKSLKETITEGFAINEAKVVKVAPKDWDRMLDLQLAGKSGDNVASKLKDKGKAMARFVAGLKIERSVPTKARYGDGFGDSNFTSFGDKALELGATFEEIEELYSTTEFPQKYIDKLSKLSSKKLDNRFVQKISKTVLDAGFDIKYMPTNGNALTSEGKWAMERNGRKWTIGYKSQIDLGNGNVVAFEFDAITDESDGPTTYELYSGSDNMFNDMWNGPHGVTKFISKLKKALSSVEK